MMYFWEINRKDMHNHNLVLFKSNLFFFSIFGFYAGCVFVDCVFVHFSKCISIAKRGTFINLKYILFFRILVVKSFVLLKCLLQLLFFFFEFLINKIVHQLKNILTEKNNNKNQNLYISLKKQRISSNQFRLFEFFYTKFNVKTKQHQIDSLT